MSNAIFIDTWVWLTLNDAGERRHREVANLYQILIAERIPIYTSTFVLDEIFTLFFKRLDRKKLASKAYPTNANR